MGWIARDAAERARHLYGPFAAHDWERFAVVAGIHWRIETLPEWLPALRIERTIILRQQASFGDMSWWFWHEVGHIMLHPGNALSDTRCTLAVKAERQADDFAELYPCWNPSIAVCRVPAVTWDWTGEATSTGIVWGGGA